MNSTLYSLGLLQSGAGFMVACLIGILSGLFLEQAGFGSSRRLAGVFYFRDMAVLKVLLTTIVVTLVGYHYLVALGWLSEAQVYVLDTYWMAQIVGGLIFGAGFVMGGWCPGTAFVGLASAKLDALVFLIGVILGSILFNEVFPLIRPLYEGLHSGTLFLYSTMEFSQEAVVLTACLIALIIFVLVSLLEKRRGKSTALSARSWKRHGAAAAILLLFAGGLFILPKRPPLPAAPLARHEYHTQVLQARDYIDPTELADQIMKAEPGLVVVDIRPREDYDAFHLRGAISIPLDTLVLEPEEKLPRDGVVVLYSNGTTHAAQAWIELRRRGWTNLKVLTGGLLGFWRECLTPPSLRGAADQETSQQALDAFQARRDFFVASEK
ncbi:MAG: YeeE/YedE thiosulfate transporter family protein [Desulfatiglandales bacterium]